MKWTLPAAAAILVVGTLSAGASSSAPPPLYDPVFLNIGFICRWDARCMDRQNDARKHALKYVQRKSPAAWRVQLCNRNARRKGQRVDWVGFNHCIKNETLRPAPIFIPAPRKVSRTHVIAERG